MMTHQPEFWLFVAALLTITLFCIRLERNA